MHMARDDRRNAPRARVGSWIPVSHGWTLDRYEQPAWRRPGRAAASSATGDYDLEILAGYHEGRRAGAIGRVEQIRHVALELGALLGRQRREGLVNRAIPGPEHLDEVGCGAVAQVEHAGCHGDAC